MRVNIIISFTYFTLLFKGYFCIRLGKFTKPDALPYQVAIFDNTRYICSGSLISDTWILTSAQCISSTSLKVILGQTNIRSDEARKQQIEIPPNNIAAHPKYNLHSLEYDMALIKLPQPVNITNNIKPVALATEESHTGKTGIVSGWGAMTPIKRGMSPDLMESSVRVISNEYCQRRFRLLRYTNIQKSNLCTNGALGETKGACIGDTGAPLVLSFPKVVQIGIVTKPLVKCTGLQPTVYTKVSAYRRWIKFKTKLDL